ncbi:MAG: chromosomal replication initiator protein DnaA [Verrucomicrobia bacterium]|nr:chromosomal replication initiator protein DnaA [Verrucomicrobiota bacterium]
MQAGTDCEPWTDFLAYVEEHCSPTAFANWFAPIEVLSWNGQELLLGVPNVFVQDYVLQNYTKELCSFLPVRSSGEPAISFKILEPKKVPFVSSKMGSGSEVPSAPQEEEHDVGLNPNYRFDTYIEGPSNQFVKSAAVGVAMRPGRSYNPLFIYGGVGLGKTHLLHSIGHEVLDKQKGLRVRATTTEAFINDLVDALRNKTVDKMKRFYRSSVDVLLVDDIQFLQNRLNFEEEFCNTFEALIHQNKQVVITSDKPPGQLKLSERMIARMEWGLVASVSVPDLETRVAILTAKAEAKGLKIPSSVAFYIAEHIYSNVRQLEGAINRLSAHCRLLNQEITEDLVENTLREMLHRIPTEKITVESILKSVSVIFQVPARDLKGSSRTKEIVLPRQVAMYLATEMVNESLAMLGVSFGGKTHSTILHARDKIEEKLKTDDILRRLIERCRRNIETR